MPSGRHNVISHGFPDYLRNIERLLLQVTHSFLPFPVDSRIPCGWSAPFAPPPLQQLRHYYGTVRPRALAWYSASCGFCRLRNSLHPAYSTGIPGRRVLLFHARA